MSTWGGIGEGLAAGMNNRIALEEQRRREAQAQANSDRDFGLRSRAADLDASLKQQDMELRGALGELDAQMKMEELEGRKEDRALRGELGRAELEGKKEDRKLRREEIEERRKSHAEDLDFRREDAKRNQANIEADRGLRSRELDIREATSDREYQIKREAQDWASKKSEEEWRSLQAAREELDADNRERRMRRDAQQKSMARQLGLAFQMLEDGGGNDTKLTMDDGQAVDARVLDSQDVQKIFGVDAAKNFAAVYAIDTLDEGTVFRVMKNDGSFMMAGDKSYFNKDARYAIYERGFDRKVADRIFRDVGEKKDLGMLTAKEQAKADAQEKARSASDPYGTKRQIDAAIAVLKADDASDGDRAAALQYLGSVFGNGATKPQKTRQPQGANPSITPAMKAKAEAYGFHYNEQTGRWEKRRAAPSAN